MSQGGSPPPPSAGSAAARLLLLRVRTLTGLEFTLGLSGAALGSARVADIKRRLHEEACFPPVSTELVHRGRALGDSTPLDLLGLQPGDVMVTVHNKRKWVEQYQRGGGAVPSSSSVGDHHGAPAGGLLRARRSEQLRHGAAGHGPPVGSMRVNPFEDLLQRSAALADAGGSKRRRGSVAEPSVPIAPSAPVPPQPSARVPAGAAPPAPVSAPAAAAAPPPAAPPAGAAAAPAAAAAASAPLRADEDGLRQLTVGMGFKESASTRALLLHRNNVELALNWLLEHSGDPHVNDPIGEDEMQALTRGRGRSSRLVDSMDFEAMEERVKAIRDLSRSVGAGGLDSDRFQELFELLAEPAPDGAP